MSSRNTKSKLTSVALLAFAFGLLVVLVPSPVAAAFTAAVPLRADGELLEERALQFVQQINTARRDPLATADRLDIDEQLVYAVFADDLAILDQGLPPLAWNANLVTSAGTHGRDMFDRLYYDYVNPEGETVEQRIASTGYQAFFVGETMNALFFENYVSLDDAFQLLVDAVLRDELTGRSAEKNIFSADVTEIGVAFFAESIALLDDQPYVYLLVADFAAPQEERQRLLVDYDPQNQVVVYLPAEDSWLYPESLIPGLLQMAFPDDIAELVVISENGLGPVVNSVPLFNSGFMTNQYIDLREEEQSPSGRNLIDP